MNRSWSRMLPLLLPCYALLSSGERLGKEAGNTTLMGCVATDSHGQRAQTDPEIRAGELGSIPDSV